MRWRPALVTIAVVGSFLASLVFYGNHENLITLVVAWALLLTAASVAPARGFEPTTGLLLALGAIALLVLNYQWSLSKDTSFAPAFVIAALPAAYLVVSRLDDAATERLGICVLAIGLILASISLVRFFAFGVRAHQPLIDPNNYACLNYLLWIPFVHRYLVRRWSGASFASRDRIVEISVSFVLVATVFATRSRTAGLIIAGALSFWLLLALIHRRSLRGPLLHVLVTGTALLAVLMRSPAAPVDVAVGSLAMGTTIRIDLLRSAWEMFADHPLTGVGLFCFGQMYGSYRAPSEQLTAGLFVHNDYLQFLAEGGVLLLVLPVVLLVFAGTRVTSSLFNKDADPARLGFTLAIGAACLHALVNFVFFSFPLVLLLGMLSSASTRRATVASEALPGRLFNGALVFGWICFAYLFLDLVTAAVFQGQPGIPMASSLRSDPQGQLRYARVAQVLNSDRGLPVLAEGVLLARFGELSGAPASIDQEALTTFRRAVRTDPWNTVGYVAMADFVRRRGSTLSLAPGEEPETLLLSAIAINPIEVGAIDRLLSMQAESGRVDQSYGLLRNVVYPWIELMKRRDDQAADRYLAELIRYGTSAGDDRFVAEVEAKQRALVGVKPPAREGWYF